MVDIDSTICDTPVIEGKHAYLWSKPLTDRIAHINQLYQEGHTIIYWTSRGGTTGVDHSKLTQQQLEQWGALYTEVRVNKPMYDVWIDDKAVNDLDFFKDVDSTKGDNHVES